MMEVKTHEGKTVCKADLRKVQDYSPQGSRYGHLPEPEAQAEAGLRQILSLRETVRGGKRPQSPFYRPSGSAKAELPEAADFGRVFGSPLPRADRAYVRTASTSTPLSAALQERRRLLYGCAYTRLRQILGGISYLWHVLPVLTFPVKSA
jgi:hypothetical protein